MPLKMVPKLFYLLALISLVTLLNTALKPTVLGYKKLQNYFSGNIKQPGCSALLSLILIYVTQNLNSAYYL